MGFWFRDLLISQSAPAEISSARLACTRAQADPMIPTYSSGTVHSKQGFEKNETTNQKVNENSILSRLYGSEFGVPMGPQVWVQFLMIQCLNYLQHVHLQRM